VRTWLATGLAVATLTTALAGCGDEEATPPATTATTTVAAAPCGPDDLMQGVISSFKVEVISNERARATFVLTREAEVGVLGFRRLLGRRVPRLRLVGRVPFGPQRSAVVNERTFTLPRPGGKPLARGSYQLTLRAFESGKLNQGAPIDTKSACVTLR
jgi:hypothetical protein